jgi:2,3-bisphosphoglycerate-dependent phosphoglycerate mutase
VDLVLVRHALPVRIESSDGPADPELTEAGHKQADAVGEWLGAEQWDAIYSSPLVRARQTAEYIAKRTGHEIAICEDIREYDAGLNAYIPYEELKATRDEHWQALAEDRLEDLAPEGATFRKRVSAAIEEIISSHAGQRVIAVAHGGAINVALAEVLGLDRDLWVEVAYASISRVAASRQGARSIVSVNETGHLRGLL